MLQVAYADTFCRFKDRFALQEGYHGVISWKSSYMGEYLGKGTFWQFVTF